MTPRRFAELSFALALALTAEPLPARAEERELVSEALETPEEGWAAPGFRMQLRTGWEGVTGLDGAPSGSGFGISFEPGVRLSERLTLGGTLRYGVLFGDFEGLRFTTTADLTVHLPWGFGATVGAGYAGLLGGAAGPCDGDGAVGVGRLSWLWASGDLFATGPAAQADLTFAKCLERSSPWAQRGLSLSWVFAWR